MCAITWLDSGKILDLDCKHKCKNTKSFISSFFRKMSYKITKKNTKKLTNLYEEKKN